MGLGQDVLASALQDLMPKYEELFTSWHPVMQRVVLNGNMERKPLDGPFKEFTVVTGGPGGVTQIVSGSEVIPGRRSQNAFRGRADVPRLIYSFDVPLLDLADLSGPQDLAKVIENYPEQALDDFHERIAKQIVVGSGSEVGGFLTLLGGAAGSMTTYNPRGTAKDGIFQFAAKGAQNHTVFGLNCSGAGSNPISGWEHEYEDVSSFATEGKQKMRKLYHAANRNGKLAGNVDLILADEDSWLNYIDTLDEQVRVGQVGGDKPPSGSRNAVPFLGADLFLESAIDVTDANLAGTAGADGLMYFLKSGTWHAFTQGRKSGDAAESKGMFEVRGPFRIPDRDMVRYEIVLSLGMFTNNLRGNGCITGTATA